ncbi:hypothetical protein ACLE2P_003632 [Providencia stuartii]
MVLLILNVVAGLVLYGGRVQQRARNEDVRERLANIPMGDLLGTF